MLARLDETKFSSKPLSPDRSDVTSPLVLVWMSGLPSEGRAALAVSAGTLSIRARRGLRFCTYDCPYWAECVYLKEGR